MLSLFRVNDPLRLILVALLLLLIRLPFLWEGAPMILPELKGMLIGEKLAQGATMYSEIWDNTGILAAAVYWFLHELFGKALWAYHLLAMLLVFQQAILFNAILFKRGLLNEKNYVAAAVYVLVFATGFDMLTLTPELISLSLLLLLARNVFYLNEEASDEAILKTGFYLGIVSLLHLPNILFLGFVILGFLVFRTPTLRHYLLLFYGLGLAWGLVGLYYFWNNSWQALVSNYMLAYGFSTKLLGNWQGLVVLLLLPTTITLVAVVGTLTSRRFINFQVNSQILMIIWLMTAAIAGFWGDGFALYKLVIGIPAIAFFITQMLLLIQRRIWAEVIFIGLGVGLSLTAYVVLYPNEQLTIRDTYSRLVVHTNEQLKGQKMLVLGDQLQIYGQASVATPYLNWALAQRHFNRLDHYDVVAAVYHNFTHDPPQVIIDPDGLAPQLFKKLPLLKARYRAVAPQRYELTVTPNQ
jgi:hypothetical protein